MSSAETARDLVREGLNSRLNIKIVTEGSITLPAVPAMLDDYTDRIARIFADVGRRFNDDERAHLRSVLERLSVETQ